MARQRLTLERLLPGPEAGFRAGDAGRDGVRPAPQTGSIDLVPPALGRGARLPRQPAGRVGVRETGRHAHELQGIGPARHGDQLETNTIPGSSAFVVEMPPGSISSRSATRQARGALTVAEGR